MAGEHGGHQAEHERAVGQLWIAGREQRHGADPGQADEARGERVADLRRRHAAAEQVQQHRRAVRRRGRGERAGGEARQPRGDVRRRDAASRERPGDPERDRDLECGRRQRAQHRDARQRTGERTREHDQRRALERPRPSSLADERQQVDLKAEQEQKDHRGLGLDRREQQRGGGEREAEAGRGLEHRAGHDAETGGGDEHRGERLEGRRSRGGQTAAAARGSGAGRRGAYARRCRAGLGLSRQAAKRWAAAARGVSSIGGTGRRWMATGSGGSITAVSASSSSSSS